MYASYSTGNISGRRIRLPQCYLHLSGKAITEIDELEFGKFAFGEVHAPLISNMVAPKD